MHNDSFYCKQKHKLFHLYQPVIMLRISVLMAPTQPMLKWWKKK